MALKTTKTDFNIHDSIKTFQETEKSIKPQKETSFEEVEQKTPTEKNIKEIEKKIKTLKNEIKVLEENKILELAEKKKADLNELEKNLDKLRKNFKGYKGVTSIRIPEEKHNLYKNFATDNNINFRQFILLSLAYTYKQAKEGKIKITDYGIETIPQL